MNIEQQQIQQPAIQQPLTLQNGIVQLEAIIQQEQQVVQQIESTDIKYLNDRIKNNLELVNKLKELLGNYNTEIENAKKQLEKEFQDKQYIVIQENQQLKYELEKQKQEQNKNIDTLNRQLKDCKDGKNDLNRQLQEQKAACERDLSEQRNISQKLQNQIDQLLRDLQDSNQQNKDCQQKLMEIKKQLEEEKLNGKQQKELLKQIEDMKLELGKQQSEIADLKKQKSGVQLNMEQKDGELKLCIENCKKLKQQLDALQSDKDNLDRQLVDEKKKSDNEKALFKQQLEVANQQKLAAEQKLNDVVKEKDKMKAQHEERETNLNNEIQQLKQQLNECKQNNADANQKLNDALKQLDQERQNGKLCIENCNQLNQKLNTLQSDKDKLANELANHQQQLQDAVKQKLLIEQKLLDMINELDEMKDLLKQRDEKQDNEVQQLKLQITKLQNQNSQLQYQNSQLQSDLNRAINSKNAIEQQFDVQSGLLENCQNTLDIEIRNKLDCQHKLDEVLQQHQLLKSSHKVCEHNLMETIVTVESLQNNILQAQINYDQIALSKRVVEHNLQEEINVVEYLKANRKQSIQQIQNKFQEIIMCKEDNITEVSLAFGKLQQLILNNNELNSIVWQENQMLQKKTMIMEQELISINALYQLELENQRNSQQLSQSIDSYNSQVKRNAITTEQLNIRIQQIVQQREYLETQINETKLQLTQHLDQNQLKPSQSGTSNKQDLSYQDLSTVNQKQGTQFTTIGKIVNQPQQLIMELNGTIHNIQQPGDVQQLMKENASLHQIIEEQKSQLQTLKSGEQLLKSKFTNEIKTMQAPPEQNNEQNAFITLKNEQLSSEIKSVKQEKDILLKQIKDKEIELTACKDENQKKEQQIENDNKLAISKIQSLMDQKVNELSALQQKKVNELSKLQQQLVVDNKQLTDKIKQLTDDQQKQQLENIILKSGQQKSQEQIKLTDETTSLKQSLQKSQNDLQYEQQQTKTLEINIDQLNNQINSLNEQLTKSNNMRDQLETKLKQLNTDNEKKDPQQDSAKQNSNLQSEKEILDQTFQQQLVQLKLKTNSEIQLLLEPYNDYINKLNDIIADYQFQLNNWIQITNELRAQQNLKQEFEIQQNENMEQKKQLIIIQKDQINIQNIQVVQLKRQHKFLMVFVLALAFLCLVLGYTKN